jgi:TPR repeat protein
MKKISVNFLFVMIFSFFYNNVISLIDEYDSKMDLVVKNEQNEKNCEKKLVDEYYFNLLSNDRTPAQENELVDLLWRGLVPVFLLKKTKIEIYDLDQKIERDPKYLILPLSFKMRDDLNCQFGKILNKAVSNNVFAQFTLAEMNYKGIGIVQNKAEGFKWYERAAEQELSLAQNKLGALYKNKKNNFHSDEEAFKWFKRAADQGLACAQNNLGAMYYYGKGCDQNDHEAFDYYKRAAIQGDVFAQTSLGAMYLIGKGIAQDYEEAFKWLTRADAQEDSFAQTYLGYMYENGLFVQKDHDEALKYYLKSGNVYWSKQHLLKCNIETKSGLLNNMKLLFNKVKNGFLSLGKKNNLNGYTRIGADKVFDLSGIQDNIEQLKLKHDILAERNNVESVSRKDDGCQIPELYNLYKELSIFESTFMDHLNTLKEAGMLVDCIDIEKKYEFSINKELPFVKTYNTKFGNFMCVGEGSVKNADFLFSILSKFKDSHQDHPLFQYYNDLKQYRFLYNPAFMMEQNDTSTSSMSELDKFNNIREEIIEIDRKISNLHENLYLCNENCEKNVETVPNLEQQKRYLIIQLVIQQRKLSTDSFGKVQKNTEDYNGTITTSGDYIEIIDLEKQKEMLQIQQDLEIIDILISELDVEFKECQKIYNQIASFIQTDIENRNNIFLAQHPFIKKKSSLKKNVKSMEEDDDSMKPHNNFLVSLVLGCFGFSWN